VLLGVDGTAHGRRERATFFSRNAEVPVMVIAVGSGMRIGGVLAGLGALLHRPLLTVERVRICKRDGRLLAPARPSRPCGPAPASASAAEHGSPPTISPAAAAPGCRELVISIFGNASPGLA